MDIIVPLLKIILFPGLAFLAVYGMLSEWVDRKCYALMQNRMGPPWYQPLADFIKLSTKEVIIPKACDSTMFRILPAFAAAAVVTTAMLMPIWGSNSTVAFQGDLVAAVYLLTIPTATFFLVGWSSTSPYAAIGSMRVLTQLFAYEVPLMMAVLGPAILAGTWQIDQIAAYYTSRPLMMLVNLPGFVIALIALQGKLERVPFDIPHGETEIVGGSFTEYSGRLLSFMLLSSDMEMVVGASLLSAVFLGGGLGLSGLGGFAVFIVKTMSIVFLLSVMKALMARIRLEQMINLCWKILAPVAMAQILVNILLKSWS